MKENINSSIYFKCRAINAIFFRRVGNDMPRAVMVTKECVRWWDLWVAFIEKT